MFDGSCVFCRIVQKQAASSVVYEDDVVVSFLDIRPLNLGHALVIPRAHFVDVFDTPADLLSRVFEVARRVSFAVREATCADGISIIQQSGRAAGQDIFHLHVHVVPRFEGQVLPRFSDLKVVERCKLEEMAQKVRQRL